MKKSFNLKQYKTAFYDDAGGHMKSQTRALSNCYKQQCDKNKSPQEAWNICIEEYQKSEKKDKWIMDYGADKNTQKQRPSAATPEALKIDKK